MPNFDGGHYFLTTLIPIATDTLVEHNGLRRSPVQVVRHALATLPTALQTRATERIGINSPFSRNTRTHVARFVVINDLMYNARDPEDAIKMAITKRNPIVPQAQDQLSCPFLLFVADFDAASGDAGELTSYLTTLWTTMEAELREVLGHCVGFEQVMSAETFAAYIRRCQIETTMPFNDYWTTPMPLTSLAKTLIGLIAAGALLGAVAGGLVFDGWFIGLIAGLALGALAAYQLVMTRARQPFPAAPHSDLPSVLKALYLQQKFTQLAIDVQGASDQDLHTQFAAFIAEHRPTDAAPTQVPGVIRS